MWRRGPESPRPPPARKSWAQGRAKSAFSRGHDRKRSSRAAGRDPRGAAREEPESMLGDIDPDFGDDAIAFIGLACRLPGAPDPEAFWRLLRDCANAITPASDRWDAGQRSEPDGPAGFWHGGFLDQIDRFDAAFFGISPREAITMDPQQRLMLELSWECLENARVAPDRLAGSQTGVFVGAISGDYSMVLDRRGPGSITAHTMTGLNRGMIANRVSYTLGLRGPSMTVDAAQSSSLVAVKMACESLRAGESTMAIAGGVHLNILAENSLSAAAFGGLSPDGRCFTFDARANGYVRGEGGGAVVLKPLRAAVGDGDPVICVIRGCAMNNAAATEGLTVPDPRA